MCAFCTQLDVQQINISHLRLDSRTDSESFIVDKGGDALTIYNAAKVSLKDIIIEDSTTPLASLLQISLCCMIEIKGHILFRSNKNSDCIVYLVLLNVQ